MTFKNMMYGFIVGDCLGVPVEFKNRQYLKENPLTDYITGIWDQPPASWSDDTSLTLALADSMKGGFDVVDMAQKMVDWYKGNEYTQRGYHFDSGFQTRDRINQLEVLLKGDSVLYNLNEFIKFTDDEMVNGNGSLMRILPCIKYLGLEHINYALNPTTVFEEVSMISSITHNHVRSSLACYFYIMLISNLLNNPVVSKSIVFEETLIDLDFILGDYPDETEHFKRLFDLESLHYDDIKSDGYVIHTLEASVWCWLNNDTYEDVVFTAVNMGDDTDTVAAIAGGIAGACYEVPQKWIDPIFNKELIDKIIGE